MSFQPSYNTASNRMASITGCTPTYDANGNTTYDCLHTYNWNVLIIWWAWTYPVPAGPRASASPMTPSDGSWRRARPAGRPDIYGPGGVKLATLKGQTVVKGFVGNVVYTATGLGYFRHVDWLGSSRFGSTPNRQMQYSQAYAPFVEIYAQTGTPDNLFTGKGQDLYARNESTWQKTRLSSAEDHRRM